MHRGRTSQGARASPRDNKRPRARAWPTVSPIHCDHMLEVSKRVRLAPTERDPYLENTSSTLRSNVVGGGGDLRWEE